MNCKDCGKENIADIHTCSPQIRELSDEEILSLVPNQDVWKYEIADERIIEFARAILKKASEK